MNVHPSDVSENNQLDIVYQLSQEIQSSAVSLLRTDLIKCIPSDDNGLNNIPSLFSNDQLTSLLEYLRSLRQWAVTIPDLLRNNNNNNSIENINNCRKDVYNSMKNLLDSLFLCLFKEDKIVSFWCFIPILIQSNIILCLSICIQVIINLLSESIQSIKLFDIYSLFIILISNYRLLICLTNYGLTLWGYNNYHQINHNRLSSHYAYLLYLLLLRNQQNDKMLKFILQNLYDKCLNDKYILYYIIEQSCQIIKPIDNYSIKIDHYQLLLIQLATSLNKFNIPLSLNGMIADTDIDINFIHLIIDITGLALLLLSQDITTNQLEQSTKSQRILPTSIKSCLGYWMSYLTMFYSSSSSSSRLMNDIMKILLNECSRLCSLWIKELIVCSPEEDVTIQANNNTVCLLHVNYPYARLRGLVHILASITFSNLDNSSDSSLITNESITPNSEGNDNDKQPVDVQSSSSILSLHQKSNEPSEQNMPITREYANELLKILCDILVITHYATHKFEEFYNFPNSIEDNLPFKNDLVKNKNFAVYPSKLAKKMVLLSTRSPFSLIQAICFKQDVIRCIVGLITQFPQLSLSLALHKFDADNYMVGDDDVSGKLIYSTTPTPSFLSTFEVILDATNRDPFNSFCVEWAILLIRLLVKSNQPHSSQVMSVLSSKLNGLNILND
ncbi:unnamed protein product [Schistosoma rodhaini]|uniref:Uncharacterized protein n=1 Tax=Schistosoma rodhaini TaxID=6188 RepID=A0AA85FDK3_9TREM|nr:unnamed protein product [Schistosoma rodhaini]